MRDSNRRWRRRVDGRAGAVVAVALGVVALMALPTGVGLSLPASGTAIVSHGPLPAVTHSVRTGNNSSGRGSFFQSQILPKAATADDACYGASPGICVNATTDPSMNLTSAGLLAVAYTSYSFTSACPGAQSEVAVTTSTDGGQAWSAPTYLDGPSCAPSSPFNSSWEPSLTSLANGTLVLAYVQYSLSDLTTAYGYTPFPPDFEWAGAYESSTVAYDRLVVAESFDSGATWTTPQVVAENDNPTLVTSQYSSPIRPFATAVGNTVYVAWTNVTTSPAASWSCGSGTSTPCARGGSTSVEFIASTDGGTTWGSIVTLSNEEGAGAAGLPVALNPTLAVLPNGRVVVAYIGNVSAWSPFCNPGYCQVWGIYPGYWGLVGGQIVAATSVDNGSSFNYSLVPLNPSSEPLWFLNPSAGVAGSRGGLYDASQSIVNPYPSMTYDRSSGQLYVAVVAGNLSQRSDAADLNGWTNDPGWNEAGTVFVTNSSDAGARWAPVRQVDPTLVETAAPANLQTCAYLSGSPGGCTSQTMGEAAVVVSNGSLLVAFGYYDYNSCAVASSGATECGMVKELVYRSTDGGYTFTPDGMPSSVLTVDDALYAGASASAIGTGSNLWIAWTEPWCPDWTSTTCEWPQAGPDGPQVVVSEPYSGTGLTIQFQQSGLPSWLGWNASLGGNLRSGPAGSALSVSGVPPNTPIGWIIPPAVGAYGSLQTAVTAPSSPASFTTSSTITVAFTPAFTGNVSVSFQASGLPTGLNWSVAFGNAVANGTSGSPINFPGVPSGASFVWGVTNGGAVNGSRYGVRYEVTSSSVTSPTSFSSDTTVTVDFSPQYLMNIESSPYYPIWSQGICGTEGNGYPNPTGPFCWDSPNDANFNYDLTVNGQPSAGGVWVTPGTAATAAVTPQAGFCNYGGGYGDTCEMLNLSFEGWVGAGAGSQSSSGLTVNVNAQGPVNETAEFQLVGICVVTGTPGTPIAYQCSGLNYTLSFVESGLPSGTEWGVTTASAVENSVASNESLSSQVNVTSISNSGIVTYRAWSVPATNGAMWVPTSTFPSTPVEPPGQAVVQVNYTLQNPNTTSFLTQIRESGLPDWVPGYGMTVGGTSYGVLGTTTNLTLEGGSYGIRAPPIYLSNGTGYYLTSVTVQPDVANWSTVTIAANPNTATWIAGPAIVTLNFANLSYVSVQTSYGGTADATSQWVEVGDSVNITATAAMNYTFVQWTGSGPGSNTSIDPTIRVAPRGPVTETAVFEHIPPTTYTATVSVTGLPAGTAATVEIGARAYSSTNGTFAIDGLNGTYVLSVPVVYGADENLSRYEPVSVTTTFPVTAGLITINGPGAINVTYQAQYAVTLESTGPGTIHPGGGVLWQNGSAVLTLTATPGPEALLVGWVGSGNGSVTAAFATIHVTVTAPITEAATFVPKPVVIPRSYTLTVTESGLPSGVSWSFSLGSVGSAGNSGRLALGELNGSYTLTVPTVYLGTGTRYQSNISGETVTLTGTNRTVLVSFTTEYAVTVVASTGGEASANESGWISAGSGVTFTATAMSGWSFVGWYGAGPGSSNATTETVSVTVNGGSMSEKALFAPLAPPKANVTTSASSTRGLPADVGLLAALLIAGLVIAFVATRGRPGGGRPTKDEDAYDEGSDAGSPSSEMETEGEP